jgi:hypothetical protein
MLASIAAGIPARAQRKFQFVAQNRFMNVLVGVELFQRIERRERPR